MPKVTPNYIEIRAADQAASKTFFKQAFGFSFIDYGPGYAAVEGGPVDIGLATGEEPAAPMPVFESDDLEASFAAVKTAGGAIQREIFAFPGGRRFEFLDPSGNRLAVYQPD